MTGKLGGNRRRFWIALIALALLPQSLRAERAEDIAIVVNPGVQLNNLTFEEVRNLLMGERQYWSSGLKVTLLIRAPAATERDVLLKKVYHMTEAQFRQYWIAKVFRAEVNAGPKAVYSNQSAVELVSAIPGSVTFVAAAKAPKTAKILKIDGHLPGEKGYPLTP